MVSSASAEAFNSRSLITASLVYPTAPCEVEICFDTRQSQAAKSRLSPVSTLWSPGHDASKLLTLIVA